MATRTTESTNTLETFRVNFNGLVDDIGNVTVSSAGDQLSTIATTVVGAINEIFAGFNLSSQISGEADNFIQSSNAETLNLIGGTGVHTGSETSNIVTDITADDTMSFLLNDTLLGITSVQLNLITPLGNGTPAATDPVVFGTALDGTGTNYNVKFASPGDANIDYGSTQGFAAAMSVALG
jgi:hypothetical protein